MMKQRIIVPHNHYIGDETFETQVERSFCDDRNLNENPYPCANITFQVTEDCNLACTYCYQHNKSKKRMTFDVAKKALDLIMVDETYVKVRDKRGVILDFIGGEPLLEIDLIEQIYQYFIEKCIALNHPWMDCHRISMCSNGVLYQDEKVKRFIEKYRDVLSFTISVDGPKDVHDACRIFHNGQGSFSYAFDAMKSVQKTFGLKNTKATIAPENVHNLSKLVKFFYEENGFDTILLNCTYEGPWDIETAKTFYHELIKISDYCYENDTYEKLYIALFEEDMCQPIDLSIPGEDKNWCGGCGQMIAVNPDGNIYPCLRYMESSLGDSIDPVIIGTVSHGIACTEYEVKWIQQMNQVTLTSQSAEECIHCPIAKGCGWCSAHNYEKFGTFNHRDTEICIMHKMRALANIDYWNRFYEKHHVKNVYENFLPKDEMIRLVGEKETNRLLNIIENQRKVV